MKDVDKHVMSPSKTFSSNRLTYILFFLQTYLTYLISCVYAVNKNVNGWKNWTTYSQYKVVWWEKVFGTTVSALIYCLSL